MKGGGRMSGICENCAVVETLQKEQVSNERYKDAIQALRITNRRLQAENERLRSVLDNIKYYHKNRPEYLGDFLDGLCEAEQVLKGR
jgi:regulator of replication initiation timing